jgi:hypothetical protein
MALFVQIQITKHFIHLIEQSKYIARFFLMCCGAKVRQENGNSRKRGPAFGPDPAD